MLELQRAVTSGCYEPLTTRVPAGMAEARAQIEALLLALESELAVKRSQLVLGGFSQGAMLATDVTLRAATPPAGLVVLSGSLLASEEWRPLMPGRSGLPVLQSHGRSDPILPYELAEQLKTELTQAGLLVEFHPWNGGHGIPAGVIDALGRFMARVTPTATD
jgi:phospholipase/carboxylesterase